MKLFLFFLSLITFTYQIERQLISVEEFKIENLDYHDIAFEAQELYDQELENMTIKNEYKFIPQDDGVIIQLDDEEVGYIRVEKLFIDIRWSVYIEFQILNKDFVYQVSYSVDSRVEGMSSFEEGWKDLVNESVFFITNNIEDNSADLEPFFSEDFEQNILEKISQNFSSESFSEKVFNKESRQIEDAKEPSEINCDSKSNPSADFYMFVCHNRDFKIFEITFYKQNEDLVHITTYTPHQDNEYYMQYEKFKVEEELEKVIKTSFEAVDEAKTYAKLNFDNYHEMVQAIIEDQSVDMFEFDGISKISEVCNLETEEIAAGDQKFFQIQIVDKDQQDKKERKLNMKNIKILRTEKFDNQLSSIKYYMNQSNRRLSDKKQKFCPLDQCHLILGEIFMDSFHYYQIKIHCKQLTADHYISFQDPNQIYDKIQFLIGKITKNIHQWRVINTQLKDVQKEYHSINFYYQVAEKLLKEHGVKTQVNEQAKKITFMNPDKTSNLFIIYLHQDQQSDDVKVTIHFYYPPELRQTSHLRDELTVSANKFMKQEIYIEDALDDYFETMKQKDESKKIVI